MMRWVWRALGIVFALLVLAAVGALSFGPAWVERGRNLITYDGAWPVSEEAAALHKTLVIGDWHADSLLWNRDLNTRGTRGHVDVPRLIEGNVALQVFTAVTKSPAGQNYETNSAEAFDNITPLAIAQLWPLNTWDSLLARALYQADRLHQTAQDSNGRLMVVTSKAELEQVLARRAQGEQVIGGILGIEGVHPLEGVLENMDLLEQVGHRVIGLQHFFDNEAGASLHGREDSGLTDFGRAIIAEVRNRGMILDLAHSSPKVVRETVEIADMPVVLSHTGLRSHCETPRNIPDDLMQAIAATGGVIGIGFWADVICDDSPAGVASAIVAAINVVGEDHVSLGSDYDGSVATSFDASELAALTHALLDTGLTEAQIEKVMGQNMIRVLRARLN